MKKSILTLLVIIPFLAIAQKQDSIIFKGASKVIIANYLSAKENYMAAGNKLISLEYRIGKKDPEFNQISIEPITIEGTNYYREFTLDISAMDNQIVIIPKTKRLNNLLGQLGPKEVFELSPFEKNKLSKDIYSRIDKIARAIGGKIIYSE